MARLFTLDRAGIREILKSDAVAVVIDGYAEQVGKATQSAVPDLPVVVESYTTDRTAAKVTVADPAGLAEQAKHGVLTRPAAAAGLEVKATK